MKELSRRDFLKANAVGLFALGAASSCFLSGCRSEKGDEIFKGVRKFVDDAGRELQLPTSDKLEKAYFTSALAQVFVMTLAPKKMGATCSRYSAEDMKYLPDELNGLKYLGAVETGEMDVEAVMSQGIQVIFSISSIALTQANIDEADSIQEKSGIPVVLIDGSFSKISHAYEVLGDLLGEEKRAKKLSDYCEDAYTRVTDAVGDIPEEQKVRFYYAEGSKGLQTEPAESQHAEGFIIAGGKDVAEVNIFDAAGMSDVSLESVIKWDPDVIIAWDSEIRGGADELIRTSPNWSTISAVRNDRVYTMPNVPMAWVDRPMACNRYLGIQWLANLFYPDRFDVDMVKVAQEYYQLFFGKSVSEQDMRSIMRIA